MCDENLFGRCLRRKCRSLSVIGNNTDFLSVRIVRLYGMVADQWRISRSHSAGTRNGGKIKIDICRSSDRLKNASEFGIFRYKICEFFSVVLFDLKLPLKNIFEKIDTRKLLFIKMYVDLTKQFRSADGSS